MSKLRMILTASRRALVGPIRSHARARALAFDPNKNGAAEKERQPPIEHAGVVPAQIIERGVGRIDERRRVRNGERNIRRNGNRGSVRIRAGVYRGEVHRGSRAVEARLLAGAAAIGKAGGSRVQEKEAIRAAIDEAAGVCHTFESGGELARFVSGLCLCAIQPIVGLGADAKYHGSRYRYRPTGRNLRKDDRQAVIIL